MYRRDMAKLIEHSTDCQCVPLSSFHIGNGVSEVGGSVKVATDTWCSLYS
jgi:hypothetical protein